MNDKTFEIYFKKHFLFPELSKKEEMECIITIQYLPENISVDKCIKKLTKATLRVILKVAKNYRGIGLPLEDLVQEGYFGIDDAIKTFNPFYDPQTRFATHAYSHIKNRILDALNTKTSNFPLPKPKKLAFWRLRKDPEKLEEKEKDELKQRLHKYEVVSLDALSSVPGFEQQFDINRPKTPEDEAIEKTNEEYLVLCLKKLLTPTEFRIALYLVGFKYMDCEQLTPKELAKKFEVDVVRIYQIKEKIRKKLVDGGLIECGKSLKKSKVFWK